MKPVIVVTGAAGFLGSHVTEALAARGWPVVGIDNFDPFYDRALKERNVAEARAAVERVGGSFDLLEGDIIDAAFVGDTLDHCRPWAVIHLAARAGVRPSIADPSGYVRVNVLGTMTLLEAARRAGVERFVLASSSSVYGNNPDVPFREEGAVEAPISPYAATKRSCELLAFTHWHQTRMPTACLRFFTVYGPRQRPDLAIATFLRRAARGEPIEVFGDGSMSRDYTYVGDIVPGILAALDRIPEHGYRVWNLGSDRPVRLDAMVAVVSRVVGREVEVRRRPEQPGDVTRTWADLTRSRRELGYHPSITLEEGVKRQWEHLRSSG